MDAVATGPVARKLYDVLVTWIGVAESVFLVLVVVAAAQDTRQHPTERIALLAAWSGRRPVRWIQLLTVPLAVVLTFLLARLPLLIDIFANIAVLLVVGLAVQVVGALVHNRAVDQL